MTVRRSRRATALLALAVALGAAALVIFGGERGPPPGASRQSGNAAASAQDAAGAMLGGDADANASAPATSPPVDAEPAAAANATDADAVFAAIDVQLARVAEGVEAERLESPAATRIGDRLRIGISSDRELHAYAFNQELGGAPTVMFPLTVLDLKNPLPGGEHELPGTAQGAHQSYTVESRAASEEILLVLATAPLPLLDAHVAALAAVAAGDASAAPIAGAANRDLDMITADATAPEGYASKVYRWRLEHAARSGI
jgi:hypothetical protein